MTFNFARVLQHVFIATMVTFLALGLSHFAQSAPKKKFKRVRPPTDADEAADIFFRDVFNDALKGSRPANLGSRPVVPPDSTNPPRDNDPPPDNGQPSGSGWSKLVSATTIENEIKRIKPVVDQSVTTPTEFNGRGHNQCRKNFSLLGMLFAIAGEYDGDVRWKEDAPAARDLFFRAGRNCKAATPASYNESKLRKADLQDMVGGGRLQSGGDVEAQADWSSVCERSQLMKRIEAAERQLRQFTASQAEFEAKLPEILHEAELLAAMGAALQKEGMEDADDDEYAAYADILKKSGREIVDAAKTKTLDAASKAMGAISRSCDDCHDVYRG